MPAMLPTNRMEREHCRILSWGKPCIEPLKSRPQMYVRTFALPLLAFNSAIRFHPSISGSRLEVVVTA
jgi:hypothetical protein